MIQLASKEKMPSDAETAPNPKLSADVLPHSRKWLEAQRALAASTNLALVTIGDDNDFDRDVANNTSICESFCSDPEKSLLCAEFCGRARQWALEAGETISYRCHANLYCFATPVRPAEAVRPLVILGGRVFLSTRDYSTFLKQEQAGGKRLETAIFRNLKFTDAQEIERASHHIISLAREQLGQHEPGHLQVAESSASVTRLELKRPEQVMENLEPYFSGSFEQGCREALRLIGLRFRVRSAALLMPSGQRFTARVVGGEQREKLITISLEADDSLLVSLREQSEPPRSLRLNEEEKARLRQHLTFNSAEAFPLFIGDELSGVLLIVDTPLDAETRQGILDFGQSVIVPLELTRLRSELSERAHAVAQWQDFARTLAALTDPAQVYSTILSKSIEVLSAERASLLILEEESQELVFKAYHGLSHEIAQNERLRLGEGIAGAVLERGEPLLVRDISDHEWVAARARGTCRTRSFISFPIQTEGRRIGVLNVADRATGESYGANDLNWLKSIAPHAAAALERIDLREKAQRFQLMSITDPLTGLLNRRYLEERFAEEVERSKRYHYPLSFMMIDIDGFKAYNDTFGHQAGDEILRATAQCIRSSLRNFDVAARYGGEEFSLVLPETEITSATALAERLRREVENHLGATNPIARQPVTISIGVASLSPLLHTTHKVIRAADQALYAAKKQGKNCVVVYNSALGPSLS
jgi:diguanylate cyclase (GGDEF)-like protein